MKFKTSIAGVGLVRCLNFEMLIGDAISFGTKITLRIVRVIDYLRLVDSLKIMDSLRLKTPHEIANSIAWDEPTNGYPWSSNFLGVPCVPT